MPDSLPLVSVVIPSYNHGQFIGRAIYSLFEQTYSHFEVIVVDNFSTDCTDRVLASYAHPNLQVLKVDNGGSIAYSRNIGVSAARGDWIAFLDSDDWWLPEKLQECADHFHYTDLIYHSLILSNKSSQWNIPLSSISWELRQPIYSHLLTKGNPIATSSVVVRRSVLDQIGGFDERSELIAVEDYDAWIRLSRITDRFLYISKNLGFYHCSPSGASSKDMSLPMRVAYASHSHLLSPAERRTMDANAAYAAGRFAYQSNRNGTALIELKKSFLHGRLELRIRSLALLIGLVGKYWLTLLAQVRGISSSF